MLFLNVVPTGSLYSRTVDQQQPHSIRPVSSMYTTARDINSMHRNPLQKHGHQITGDVPDMPAPMIITVARRGAVWTVSSAGMVLAASAEHPHITTTRVTRHILNAVAAIARSWQLDDPTPTSTESAPK